MPDTLQYYNVLNRFAVSLVVCLIGITLLSASKCQSKTCTDYAVVRDMSKLDGCSLILETSKGQNLLPTNLTEYAPWIQAGDTISISFDVIKDAMSICMYEDNTVELTCIEIMSTLQCEPFLDPVDVPWALEILKTSNPDRITFYQGEPRSYYKFHMSGTCALYTCTGVKVCSGTCDEKDACEVYFAEHKINIIDQRIIYVQDH